MNAMRKIGVRVDREGMLGTLIGGRPDRAHRALGFGVHLVISGGFGVAYDAAFARLGSTDVRTGVLLSPAHFLVSGSFFAVFDRVHPLVPEVFRDPGPFLIRFGARGPAVLLLVKAVFGATVAAIERAWGET